MSMKKNNKLKNKFYVLIIGITLIIVLISIFIKKINKNENMFNIEQECVKVKQSNIQESIYVNGKVESASNIVYYSNSNAKITSIASKGTHVNKGDVIVSFDTSSLLDEYNKVKLQSDATIAENNQLINNYYAQKQADPEYEDGTFSHESLSSNISLAKDAINTAYGLYEKAKNGIVAETDGIVLSVETTAGNQATDGMPLLTISDPNTLCAKVSISKNDFSKVKNDEACEIEIGNVKYSGKVIAVDEIVSINENGNSVLYATLSINNTQNHILIGEDVKAEILMPEKKGVLVVPVSSVNISKKGYFVYIYKNNKRQKKAVTIGSSDKNYIEITSGIALGDYVFKEIPTDDLDELGANI